MLVGSLFAISKLEGSTAVTKHSITVRRSESLTHDLDRLTELIRQRAYDIFLSRGARDGADLDHWLLAEQQLVVRPAIRLRQRNGHIELDAAVEDLDLADLDVRVAPQHILISAQTGAATEGDETRTRTLFGSVGLPHRIDPSTVKAEFRNGLIHVTASLATAAATAVDHRGVRES